MRYNQDRNLYIFFDIGILLDYLILDIIMQILYSFMLFTANLIHDLVTYYNTLQAYNIHVYDRVFFLFSCRIRSITTHFVIYRNL